MGDTTRRADGRHARHGHYFTFFLQEKGKPKSVFQDWQKLIPGSVSGEPAKDSTKILEGHLGNRIECNDSDFMVCFTKIEKIAKGHKEGVWRQENI